ncbi:MAG: MFS transporter, partial [Chloroflexi bacterium]|nr:MFS transporter [Chloroflexota bacterium]
MLAAIYSATTVAPLVGTIARDFSVTPGTVGLLVAAYTVPGIVAALITGPLADRLGRRRFMIGGAVVSGVFTVLGALAPTYPLLLLARGIAGMGAAVIMPNVVSTTAELYSTGERGRAVASLFLANTTASLAGVAVAGILAEQTGWRLSLAGAGVLSLASAAALARWPAPVALPVQARGMLGTYVFVLTDRSAMATPCSHLPGAVAWGTWATFVVAYLEGTFGLAQGIASTYALAQGVGLLAGTQLGGRLGDRFGTRRTIVIAVLAYGAAIGLVPNAGMPLLPTLALTFAAAACFGVRAVGNAALLTEQATAARTTAFAFSSAMVAAGTAFGGAAG